jgi:site-specific DNA-methyltransferase (adenine-specific)
MTNKIYFGDNLPILREMESESVNIVYIDPPFNTGRTQRRTQIKTVRSDGGDRTGFAGRRYETVKVGTKAYHDLFDDYLSFLEPRLREAHRILTADGSLYFHIDWREAHYCKILLDDVFGRDSFLNEIIWAYDYGARQKKKWPAKHDTIFLYVKDPKDYVFNFDEMDRIPYMAPGLVGKEKAERGKTPTDVWWHTIVATNSKEKTGYATQKPLGILKRIIKVSSRPGDTVLDFFAGSGTAGEAAHRLGRRFILMDDNPQALEVMAKRFEEFEEVEFVGYPPQKRSARA